MSHVPPGPSIAPRPAPGRLVVPYTTSGSLFAPRPASSRARGRPVSRQLAGLLAAAIAVASAGCGPAFPVATPDQATAPASAASPPTTPVATLGSASTAAAADRPDLLLVSPDEGATSLILVRRSGDAVSLPLPDPSIVAVAPITEGRLLALCADGRAFVAGPGSAGLPGNGGWQELTLRGTGAIPGGAEIWSATSSPDGSLVAAIARPRDAEFPSTLVIVDAGHARRDVLSLADASEGIAPAWIDGGRVAILQRDRLDRPFIAIVDVATGGVTDRLAIRGQDIVTARDGRTVAIQADGRVVVGSTAALLALRRAPLGGPEMLPGDRISGGIALSGDGRPLAVAVEEGEPGQSRIAIYELDGGAWRASDRITPPRSASGGWLSWLP